MEYQSRGRELVAFFSAVHAAHCLTRKVRVPGRLFFFPAQANKDEPRPMSETSSMFERYDVMQAAKWARIAIRRGDLDAAERWYRVADRAATIAQRLAVAARASERSRWSIVRNPV